MVIAKSHPGINRTHRLATKTDNMKSLRNFLSLIGILLVSAIYLRLAIVGVDYHHQGLVFSAAMRVAQGQELYSDVFSQYGPLPTYVQAIAIKVFGEKVLALIILSVLLQLSSALMMYKIWKEDLSRDTAVFSILIWACTSYYLRSDYSFFPWWNDFTLFFSCALILALRRLEKMNEIGKYSQILVVAASLLISAILLTRLHIGVLMVVILGIRYRKTNLKLHFFWRIQVGAIAFIFLLIALTDKAIWQGYVYQTISWPLRWIGGTMPGSPPLDRLVYALAILGFTPIAILYMFKAIISSIKNGRNIHRAVFSVSVVLVIWILKGMVSTTYWATPDQERLSNSVFNSQGVIWALTLLFLYWSISETRSKGLNIEKYSVNVTVAVVLLTQIYPVPDHAHLWMCVLPLIGPTITSLLSRVDLKFEKYIIIGASFFLLINMTSAATVKIQSPEYVRSTNRFTEGMYEERATNKLRTELFRQIETIVEGRKLLNICQDGMYDAFGAKRKNPDPYQIFWGPGADGSYFPNEPLDDKRVKWLNENSAVVIYCGQNEEFINKLMSLKYSEVYATGANGYDSLGGTLGVRIFESMEKTSKMGAIHD